MIAADSEAKVLRYLADDQLGWKWTHWIGQKVGLTEEEAAEVLEALEGKGQVKKTLANSPGRRVAPIRNKPGWKITDAGFVDQLSARTAHVTHALLAAWSEPGGPGPGPLKVGEIIIYDWEALDTRMTGAALTAARRHGLVDGFRGLWFATPKAHELRGALEDRSLRDEEARDG